MYGQTPLKLFSSDRPLHPAELSGSLSEGTTLEKPIGDIKQFLECDDPETGIVIISDSNASTQWSCI